MKKILLSILGLALLVSCEKEIEFKGEQLDPKLVIGSLVEPGQPVSAYITKSYFFLDSDEDTMAPDDLAATLYVNGNRIGEMTPHYDTLYDYHNGYLPDMGIYHLVKVFTHPYCVAEGDVVKVTASANGFDDVAGESSPVPKETAWRLISVDTTSWDVYSYSYDEDEEGTLSIDAELEIVIEITDPNPGHTDYFKIEIDGSYNDFETGNTFYFLASYNDPVFENIDTDIAGGYLPTSKGLFTDLPFDGKSYQIKLPVSVWISILRDPDPDFFHMPIKLEHVSKEYYYYLNTCEQDDELMQFFAEPVQTYSNVDGGYGLVGAHWSSSIDLPFPVQFERSLNP